MLAALARGSGGSKKWGYACTVALREISRAVISEGVVHRAERVPNWYVSSTKAPWRALCGAKIGVTREGGAFEFEVAVALDPLSWRLAANCPGCVAATERRELGSVCSG